MNFTFYVILSSRRDNIANSKRRLAGWPKNADADVLCCTAVVRFQIQAMPFFIVRTQNHRLHAVSCMGYVML